jgi:hypothetical protein
MRTLIATLLLLSTPSLAASLDAVAFDWEVGPLYVFHNEGRYGQGGTRYDAADVGQQRNLLPSQRMTVGLAFGERHALQFLYAPLQLVTTAQLPADLVFRGTTFPAGEVVEHRYLFDGYRATWLFSLVRGEKLTFALGPALQIRNAAVEFTATGADRYAIERDIGLVFAPTFLLRYQPSPKLWSELEVTALSTFGLVGDVSGGIIDAALTLGLPVRAGADLFFRLRFYGGGAEVPRRELENWGYFGVAAMGARLDAVSLLR